MSWALQIYSSVWNFKEINNHASDSYFYNLLWLLLFYLFFIEEACMTGVEYEINTFVKQKTKFLLTLRFYTTKEMWMLSFKFQISNYTNINFT